MTPQHIAWLGKQHLVREYKWPKWVTRNFVDFLGEMCRSIYNDSGSTCTMIQGAQSKRWHWSHKPLEVLNVLVHLRFGADGERWTGQPDGSATIAILFSERPFLLTCSFGIWHQCFYISPPQECRCKNRIHPRLWDKLHAWNHQPKIKKTFLLQCYLCICLHKSLSQLDSQRSHGRARLLCWYFVKMIPTVCLYMLLRIFNWVKGMNRHTIYLPHVNYTWSFPCTLASVLGYCTKTWYIGVTEC